MTFSFKETALIVLGLLFMAIPGYIIVKTKTVKENAIGAVAKITLFCAQPFLMISLFNSTDYNSSFNKNILIVLGVSIFLYLLFFIILPFILKFRKNESERRTLSFAAMFGNTGFMGIPILKALLPNSPNALIYIAFVLFVFNALSFIIGVYAITWDRKYIKFNKLFLNPVMIGLYVGAFIFFFKIKLPDYISSSFSLLGNASIPLSMILLGMRFATADVSKLFNNIGVYAATFIKLLVFPSAAYLIMLPFNIDATIQAVIIITSAMPCSAMALMFAESYNQDSYAASQCMLLSTALSVLSIPFVLWLLF